VPIYEYKCTKCGNIEEHIVKETDIMSYVLCFLCKQISIKIVSAPHFRVTGFNAQNGYNLPNYNDVIDADGHAKEKWGKK
jgi:putative FmdB family regulatory protein